MDYFASGNRNCIICKNEIHLDEDLFVACINVHLMHQSCQEGWSGSMRVEDYRICSLCPNKVNDYQTIRRNMQIGSHLMNQQHAVSFFFLNICTIFKKVIFKIFNLINYFFFYPTENHHFIDSSN